MPLKKHVFSCNSLLCVLGASNVNLIPRFVFLTLAAVLISIPHSQLAAAAEAGPAAVKPESLNELYQKAKNEGRVVIYAASSTNTEQIVFPAFEKRFPGITVNHVNATADKLVARAIAEARGGKILAEIGRASCRERV